MYLFAWIIINFLMVFLGDFGFESPFYWIVQAIFLVGVFIKKDD